MLSDLARATAELVIPLFAALIFLRTVSSATEICCIATCLLTIYNIYQTKSWKLQAVPSDTAYGSPQDRNTGMVPPPEDEPHIASFPARNHDIKQPDFSIKVDLVQTIHKSSKANTIPNKTHKTAHDALGEDIIERASAANKADNEADLPENFHDIHSDINVRSDLLDECSTCSSPPKTFSDTASQSSSCTSEDSDEDSDEDGEEEDVEGDEDEEYVDPLIAVRQLINFEAIKQKAIECRMQQLGAAHAMANSDQQLTCDIDPEEMQGSYNLVYVIRWSDGSKWVVRIPGSGCNFNLLNAVKMDCEYNTMNYLRRKTGLPIPEVFNHTWATNVAGVPFALMAFVEGQSLYSFWHNPRTTEKQKLDVLASIAPWMAKLSQAKTSVEGMLYFDNSMPEPTVGPAIEMGYEDLDDKFQCAKTTVQHKSLIDELSQALEQSEYRSKRAGFRRPILRMAIDSIPGYLAAEGLYSISPPDFNLQNIMVDDDGKITGFIDWDGVQFAPMCLGALRYPLWITRDWQLGYEFEPEVVMTEYPEASPAQLSSYRRHYLQAMMDCQHEGYDSRWTKLSHIFYAVYIGVVDDMCSSPSIWKLFEHCKLPFTPKDYADAYEADDTEEKDGMIKEAFAKMWHAEWEEEGEVEEGEDRNTNTQTSGSKAVTCDMKDEWKKRHVSWHSVTSLAK